MSSLPPITESPANTGFSAVAQSSSLELRDTFDPLFLRTAHECDDDECATDEASSPIDTNVGFEVFVELTGEPGIVIRPDGSIIASYAQVKKVIGRIKAEKEASESKS